MKFVGAMAVVFIVIALAFFVFSPDAAPRTVAQDTVQNSRLVEGHGHFGAVSFNNPTVLHFDDQTGEVWEFALSDRTMLFVHGTLVDQQEFVSHVGEYIKFRVLYKDDQIVMVDIHPTL
jgi:hypothetical protein